MDNLDIRHLPHEFLLRKYGLKIEDMSSHTKQLKGDLDKTLTLLLNRAKNGEVRITPATQSKIETYDRYICDGIFEYLEGQDVITEKQSDAEEKAMDDKRENVIDKMEESNKKEEPKKEEPKKEEPKPSNQSNTTPPSEEKKKGGDVKIGFWNWK
jgi:hypothetical protein